MLFALAINIGCNQSGNTAGIIPGGVWMCEIKGKKPINTQCHVKVIPGGGNGGHSPQNKRLFAFTHLPESIFWE